GQERLEELLLRDQAHADQELAERFAGVGGPGGVDEAFADDDAFLYRTPLDVERTRLLARGNPLEDVGQRHRLEVALEAHRRWSARSALVEVDIPEEVVPPALRSAMQPEAQGQVGERLGTTRLAYQVHACFLGAAIALPSVAGNAAGHDVVPAL